MVRKSHQYYNIRGRLYELAVDELVQKAGFETDRNKLRSLGIKQLSTKGRTVHGRGSTYQADIVGLYSLPIPFTYPLLLIGEAKYHQTKVRLNEARQFLGVHTDISQYPKINTKSKEFKYSEMFKEARYTYTPVIFSANGFDKNPQALLHTHGIYFISYENSPIFGQMTLRLKKLLKQINVKAVVGTNMQLLYSAKALRELSGLEAACKKAGFDKALTKLLEITEKTNSYIGMLDGRLMVHILSNTRLRRPTHETIDMYPLLLEGNFIQLKSSSKKRARKLGGFSMPSQFLELYIKDANKNNKSCFKELVIYKNYDGKLFPIYVKFSEQGKNEILESVREAAQTRKNYFASRSRTPS